jgi:hypothetical protein
MHAAHLHSIMHPEVVREISAHMLHNRTVASIDQEQDHRSELASEAERSTRCVRMLGVRLGHGPRSRRVVSLGRRV